MNVITINGSSKKDGNTAIALDTVSEALKAEGISTKRIEIGSKAIHGCIGCGRCGREQDRRCVFGDDILNHSLDDLFAADGVVVGSPVYYAGINGAVKCFLDRAFYVGAANGHLFRHKVGAGVVAVRRGGETTAWDQLNKYFTISEMYVPSGHYWNMLFGTAPGEGRQDAEGLQTMQLLGRNMAWLLKAIDQSKTAMPLPPQVDKTYTNFIR